MCAFSIDNYLQEALNTADRSSNMHDVYRLLYHTKSRCHLVVDQNEESLAHKKALQLEFCLKMAQPFGH